MTQQIIPYTSEAIRWHLHNNAGMWSDVAVERIVSQIEKVNTGEASLTDFITESVEIRIFEMLDDLKIEYNAEIDIY